MRMNEYILKLCIFKGIVIILILIDLYLFMDKYAIAVAVFSGILLCVKTIY